MSAPPSMEDIYRGFTDHQRWAEACLSVREKSGALIPYALQPAQIGLNYRIRQIREKGKPVRIVVLKARQVMVSTFTAGYFYQQIGFKSGQHGMVVAHLKKAADNLAHYYQTFHDHHRPYEGLIHPLPDAPKQGRGLAFEGDSWLSVETAGNVKTGRSFSLRYLHLSEYAFYPDPGTLMTGLMQCVPDDPDTCVIVESTANGIGNPFAALWEEATDPSGDSDWEAYFFGWAEHPEYTMALRQPAHEFQASLDDEEREMMRVHRLTLEQSQWRRWAIKNKCEGDIERFRQEYPLTPEEAFRSSGRPKFSIQHLSRMPIIRDAIQGGLREEDVGTRTELYFEPREKGELTIYHKPSPKRLYVIGADTAQGIDINDGEGTADPDWSVACVLDIDSGEQVAKLRARLEPSPFGQYLAALGRWYNWAYLVPEINDAGIATVEELLREQYPTVMLYHRKGNADDLTKQQSGVMLSRVGFKTGPVTRPQILSKLDRAIREMQVVIRDPHTLRECRTFVIKPNGRAEHDTGCHDDEVFALALAVEGLDSYPEIARQQRQPLRVQQWGAGVEETEVQRRYQRVRVLR